MVMTVGTERLLALWTKVLGMAETARARLAEATEPD